MTIYQYGDIMDRIIKFRAWIKPQKKMVSVLKIDWLLKKCGGLLGGISYETEIAEHFVLEEHINLMQYIGLKNKKGVDIYEGDIISKFNQNHNGKDSVLTDTETKIYKYIIRWNKERAIFEGKGIHKSVYTYGSGIEECEVIGNIYENPELLA